MPIATGMCVSHGDHEYIIGALIKEGGFGRVYHAERTRPSPLRLAVKVPAEHILKDPVWSKKFEREARILANIKHPHVVKILAFWTMPDGTMALAQELVPGALPLHQYAIANAVDMPSLFLQTLYALRAIHGPRRPASAIHRDLSPENILVSGEAVAKVIDFGLAKEDPRQTEILTRTGVWFGTQGCMAPEQTSDARDVDHRADLFALGKSFTAALQNRNPLHADPSRLPDPWRALCQRLCEHDVDDRYPDAESAIVEAMERFASKQMPITRFDLHVAEMARWDADIATWPQLCWNYFDALPSIDFSAMKLVAELRPGVFQAKNFDSNAFIDKCERGPFLTEFNEESAEYDDCDLLSDVYERLFLSLDEAHKVQCLRRLARTAVKWHRYAVMKVIRKLFKHAWGATMSRMLVALEEEDPGRVVHGRGVIPGRDP